jgi:hypothetical protein
MRRSARLDQADIELAIKKALAECGEIMINGSGSWKLIKADKPGERDSLAFICEIVKVQSSKEPEASMVEMPA